MVKKENPTRIILFNLIVIKFQVLPKYNDKIIKPIHLLSSTYIIYPFQY